MTEVELLALDDLQFIERAYPFALGRPADPRGLRDYLQRLRSGTPKVQVLEELFASEEGRAYLARQRRAPRPTAERSPNKAAEQGAAIGLNELLQLDDDDFVQQAYRLVLGRDADETGRRNYRIALQTGIHPLELLRLLMDSEEGRTRNVELPEIRIAIERRRLGRLPGIRHALRVWTLARRRWRAEPRRPPRMAEPPKEAARTPAVKAPIPPAPAPAPALGPVVWPAPNLSRRASQTMNEALPSPGDGPVAAGRLDSAADLARVPDTVSPTGEPERRDRDASAWSLTIENFVGPTMHGWSFSSTGEHAAFSIEFGGRMLGRVEPTIERHDVQEAFGLSEPRIGFSAILGGLLQFSAMAQDCAAMRLSHGGSQQGARIVDLREHLEQALTFSPMRALLRPLLGHKAGAIRSIRLVSAHDASMLFEADTKVPGGAESVFVELYQEKGAGSLARIARFAIELSGQMVDLGFRLHDADAPVLMVVTDPTRAIIATDCFPLPVLHSEANAPLIEYHVVLETGKPAYGIAAKIARTFLDSAVNGRLGNLPASVVPRPAGTCLMLYARGHADLHVPTLLKSSPVAAAEAVFLDRQAMVHRASGRVLPLPAFLAETQARHLLLLESGTHLRPDFWSIIADHGFRLQDTTDLIHWPSIWMDGLSRPQVVKSGLLMHPAFEFHALLEARSMLVRREAMVDAVQQQPELWRSGRLVLEKALCGVAAERVATVPTVMDIVRVPIAPLVQQRFESEQVALPQHPGSTGRPRPHAGVSLIINYRDAVDDTLRCLQAVRAQDANGPLEIVLVNNGSTSQSTARILGRARELFGSDAVKPIDYPQRFNHSEQCNIAAVAARHDLLLMLSNDSCLRTPLAIARAAELAAVPWVGTCGFRVVGNEATKGRLQSLGLSLNERRYLFSGGSPLTSGLPPAFSLACTFEVIGNTFAAAMVRRDVYVSLDGLDSVAFPTSYNDIDFSFRALQAGYRHVVIGSEIVEHVGRGSREADQDLPIDQRIIERAPRLDVLTRIGFQQL